MGGSIEGCTFSNVRWVCMSLVFVLIFSLLLMTGSTKSVWADEFGDATAAYSRGEYATAIRLFRPLAEQGNARAQNFLGIMYQNGQGVVQDYKNAAMMYSLAAQQGYAWAQNLLGFMYAEGEGISQDYVRAHMWIDLSASNLTGEDREIALKNRALIATKMTPAQLAQAQELAKACQASNYRNCEMASADTFDSTSKTEESVNMPSDGVTPMHKPSAKVESSPNLQPPESSLVMPEPPMIEPPKPMEMPKPPQPPKKVESPKPPPKQIKKAEPPTPVPKKGGDGLSNVDLSGSKEANDRRLAEKTLIQQCSVLSNTTCIELNKQFEQRWGKR